MTADEVLVGEINGRRIDGASDHARWLREEILVVRRLGRTVGNHQRWLTAAPSAPATLRVVRGRRRYVSHVDRVERGDVHAQFHRRRTEEDRQTRWLQSLAEPRLALLTDFCIHLRRVFSRLQLVKETVVAIQKP